MEPLILPFVEFVRGLDSAAGWMIAGIGLSVLGVVASVINRLFWSRWKAVATAEDPQSAEPEPNDKGPAAQPTAGQREPFSASNMGFVRQTLRCLVFVGIWCATMVAAVEYLGAEPLLRWSLGKLEAKTGVKLTFGQATGGPLRGEFVLRQVRAVRQNHPYSNFDIVCSQVTVRFSFWKLLGSQLAFEDVRAEQISGEYDRIGRHEPGSAPGDDLSKTEKPKKNIPIGHLEIRDATIDYTDSTVEGDPIEFALGINSLVCRPFRTAYAPYDIVFRSEVDGTLDQQPFRVHSSETATERKTEWEATGLPVKFARAYLGGPFRWLAGGKVDALVTQTTNPDPRVPVVLETTLKLREIQTGVPGNVKPAVALAARIVVSQLKLIPKEKTFGFKLKLEPEKFDLTKTEDLDRLWQQFKQAAVAGLVQSTGIKPEGLSPESNQKVDQAVNAITDEALKALERIKERRKAKKAAKGKEPAPQE